MEKRCWHSRKPLTFLAAVMHFLAVTLRELRYAEGVSSFSPGLPSAATQGNHPQPPYAVSVESPQAQDALVHFAFPERTLRAFPRSPLFEARLARVQTP